MPMYETDDIVEQKKREKRKKNFIRFIVVTVLLTLAGAAYVTHEMWLPKLRGLGKQYTTIVNDGRLAAGNFPIEVNDSESFQLDCSKNCICVLSDASIYLYSKEGGLIKRRQHAYTNAVMDAVEDKILIYESGGTRFSVEDRSDIVYSKKLTESIMFARLSPEGYTAVVTTSADYDCEILVYDRDGKEIYKRQCVERVNDISFVNESEGCVISYIYAENGSLVTSVQETLFTESSEKWKSPGLDTLGIQTNGYSGGAAVIGIDACGYVDKSGNIRSIYHYDGEFAGGDCEDGKSAVIINSADTRKYKAVLFSDDKAPIELNFETPLVDVTVQDGLAFIMTENSVEAYDFDGGLRSTAQIRDSYTGFARTDGYIFLKSYDKIDRINYES